MSDKKYVDNFKMPDETIVYVRDTDTANELDTETEQRQAQDHTLQSNIDTLSAKVDSNHKETLDMLADDATLIKNAQSGILKNSQAILANTNNIQINSNDITKLEQVIEDDVASLSKYKNVILIGDSYGSGYTAEGYVTGWCKGVADKLTLLGYNVRYTSTGGAGWIGNNRSYQELLEDFESEITDKENIGLIYVAGGYNDINYVSTVPTGCKNFMTYVKKNYPNAIVCYAPIGASFHSDSERQSKLRDNYNYFFGANIDGLCVLTSAYFLLNSNRYMSSDNVHPNATGQGVIMSFIYNSILGKPYFGGYTLQYKLDGTPWSTMSTSFVQCTANNNIMIYWIGLGGAVSTTIKGNEEYQLFDIRNGMGRFNTGYTQGIIQVRDTSNVYHNLHCMFYIFGTKLCMKINELNSSGTGFYPSTEINSINVQYLTLTTTML